nr:MAG TPA: hypothetical protein [Caudoviricetes sp.]
MQLPVKVQSKTVANRKCNPIWLQIEKRAASV